MIIFRLQMPEEFKRARRPSDIQAVSRLAVLIFCVIVASNVRGDSTSVVAWGDNRAGQTNVPISLTNAVAVSAGYYYSLALRSDSTVTAWGDNYFGTTNVPSGLTGVVAISAGDAHCLALTPDGKVVGWGDNQYAEATAPAAWSNMVAIAAGSQFSLGLRYDGTVLATGDNENGVINVPHGLSNVTAIAAGEAFGAGLLGDGTVRAWGENDHGESTLPIGLSNVVAISTGDHHGLALKVDGTVAAWGYNWAGQASVPTGLSNVVEVAGGNWHSLALKDDGTILEWGQATNPPASVAHAIGLAGGGFHDVALLGSGFPVIVLQPINHTLFSGENTFLKVGVAGQPVLTYQWYFNGTNLPNVTNSFVLLTNVQPTNMGTYQASVSNGLGGVLSTQVVVTVVTSAPIVLTHPADQTVVATANVGFSATVVGSLPITYQWQFHGTNITGATNPSLSLTNVGTADAGPYNLIASNTYGSTSSSNAMLTVLPLKFYNPRLWTNPPLGLELDLSGVITGRPLVVFASSNLVDWVVIYTNSAYQSQFFEMFDSSALNLPQRFYKARQ